MQQLNDKSFICKNKDLDYNIKFTIKIVEGERKDNRFMARFDLVMFESAVETPCILIVRNLPLDCSFAQIRDRNYRDMSYIESRLVQYYPHNSYDKKKMLYMFCKNSDAKTLRDRFMNECLNLGGGKKGKVDYDSSFISENDDKKNKFVLYCFHVSEGNK